MNERVRRIYRIYLVTGMLPVLVLLVCIIAGTLMDYEWNKWVLWTLVCAAIVHIFLCGAEASFAKRRMNAAGIDPWDRSTWK